MSLLQELKQDKVFLNATENEIDDFCQFCGVVVGNVIYIPFLGDLFGQYKQAIDRGVEFIGTGLHHEFRYKGKRYQVNGFVDCIRNGYAASVLYEVR